METEVLPGSKLYLYRNLPIKSLQLEDEAQGTWEGSLLISLLCGRRGKAGRERGGDRKCYLL
jgi:hypothetical protein